MFPMNKYILNFSLPQKKHHSLSVEDKEDKISPNLVNEIKLELFALQTNQCWIFEARKSIQT